MKKKGETSMDTRSRGGRMSPSASFLVRCWLEPREVEGAPPVVRVTLRDLRTGEEEHLGDARQLGERVLRHLEALAVETGSGEAHREGAEGV